MSLTKYVWLAMVVAGGAGCAATEPVEDEPAVEVGTGDEALGTQNKSYVTARRDFRKCMAPLCGGYYVRDVNRKTAERYVSGFDFSPSGLDQASIDKVLAGEELVLRGKLGPADPQFGTRAFLVYEAYRGMPGVAPIEGDIYYTAAPRDPQIQCFAAPCDNEIAKKLNFASKTPFTSYSVNLAALDLVDQAWLVNQVQNHGAATAALIMDGYEYQTGTEKVLDSSQVYLRLPVQDGPCPKMPQPVCDGGTVPTFVRSADRCVLFDGCVVPGMCAQYIPSCAEGYSLVSWDAGPDACPAYACDPTFTVE